MLQSSLCFKYQLGPNWPQVDPEIISLFILQIIAMNIALISNMRCSKSNIIIECSIACVVKGQTMDKREQIILYYMCGVLNATLLLHPSENTFTINGKYYNSWVINYNRNAFIRLTQGAVPPWSELSWLIEIVVYT